MTLPEERRLYAERTMDWLDRNTVDPVENFLRSQCTKPEKIDELQQEVQKAIMTLDGLDNHLVQDIRFRLGQVEEEIRCHNENRGGSGKSPTHFDSILSDASFYHKKLSEVQSLKGLGPPKYENMEKALKYDLLRIPFGFLDMGYMCLITVVGMTALIGDAAAEACTYLAANVKKKFSPSLSNQYS